VKQAVDIKADVETLEQTKIAFCSHREGIESYIYVMNTDGSEQKRLTKKRVAGSFPHWSPFIKSKK
jgi:Tol biopolymer transport system component